MIEHDIEPIRGLPGMPPPGEHIVWQGSPDWRVLARGAFHTRLIAAYFALLTAWALANALHGGGAGAADFTGVGMTGLLGVAVVALLHLLAWGSARTTIYTLTNRRVVLRIGMAVPKCVNLPLARVGAVDLALHRDGAGDVVLTITGEGALGYAALWPHAKPWTLAPPRPALRAVPAAAEIAALVARTCGAAVPSERGAETEPPRAPAPIPVYARAAA